MALIRNTVNGGIAEVDDELAVKLAAHSWELVEDDKPAPRPRRARSRATEAANKEE